MPAHKANRRLGVPIVFLAASVSAGAQVPRSDLDAERNLYRDRLTYLSQTRPTPNAREILTGIARRQDSLGRRVLAREARGEDTTCSHQILSEIYWMADDTADFDRVARRLDDLEAVLAHPEEEAKARQQDPSDGSWGRCHTEWFFRVNATYDHVTSQAGKTEKPRYSLQLLDRVNSPEKLRRYFDSVAVSDVAGTGRSNRRELNESLENLGRLILRGQPSYYKWDSALKEALMDIILNRLRNPQTGFWGARFVRGGQVEFVDDLSITFHMISTLKGQVPELGKTMDHLLAVKDLDYEIGWLRQGGYSNHHNMDVVALFSYGWPAMTDRQKQAAAAEIGKMMRWCLAESLQPDGSFRIEQNGDSAEEQISFGAAFLARAGFFDRAKRFWTAEEFPRAEEVRRRIVGYMQAHLTSGGAGGTYYQDTLQELGAGKDRQ
jgi:hypothetical protein